MTGGVKDEHCRAVIDALAANERVERVVLFGSRVAEAYRASSDIDLALFGDGLTQDDVSALSAEMEALPLAQHVDLVLGDAIDDATLRAHIEAEGVEWFKRNDVECRIHVFSKGGEFTSSPQMIVLYPNETSVEPLHAGVGDTEVFWSGNLVSRVTGIKLPAKLPFDWGQSMDVQPVRAFVVAEGHRAYLGEKPLKPGNNIITLNPVRGGGSAIFGNGAGRIPGLSGYIGMEIDNSGRLEIFTENTSIKDPGAYSEILLKGIPLVLEDIYGGKIRLTLKEEKAGLGIVEYEWLTPQDDTLSESDDWEPLSIDRGNPVHAEAIENTIQALEDVIESLRGINDHPEANAEMLKVFENDKTKLKTANSISWDGVKKTFEALKKAEQLFSYSERVIRIIELATQVFIRMIEILSSLPFPF